MCPNPFDMVVCKAVFEFFMQPGIVFLAGLFTFGLIGLLIYLIFYLHKDEIATLKEGLAYMQEEREKLLRETEVFKHVQDRHMIKNTLPEMHLLVKALRSGKTSVPSDQAISFLKSLIALWGNEDRLNKVREELLAYNDPTRLKEGESSLGFELWWSCGESKDVTFFVNWKKLATPFSFTVWLN